MRRMRFLAIAVISFVATLFGAFLSPSTWLHKSLAVALCGVLSANPALCNNNAIIASQSQEASATNPVKVETPQSHNLLVQRSRDFDDNSPSNTPSNNLSNNSRYSNSPTLSGQWNIKTSEFSKSLEITQNGNQLYVKLIGNWGEGTGQTINGNISGSQIFIKWPWARCSQPEKTGYYGTVSPNGRVITGTYNCQDGNTRPEPFTMSRSGDQDTNPNSSNSSVNQSVSDPRNTTNRSNNSNIPPYPQDAGPNALRSDFDNPSNNKVSNPNVNRTYKTSVSPDKKQVQSETNLNEKFALKVINSNLITISYTDRKGGQWLFKAKKNGSSSQTQSPQSQNQVTNNSDPLDPLILFGCDICAMMSQINKKLRAAMGLDNLLNSEIQKASEITGNLAKSAVSRDINIVYTNWTSATQKASEAAIESLTDKLILEPLRDFVGNIANAALGCSASFLGTCAGRSYNQQPSLLKNCRVNLKLPGGTSPGVCVIQGSVMTAEGDVDGSTSCGVCNLTSGDLPPHRGSCRTRPITDKPTAFEISIPVPCPSNWDSGW